MHQLLRIIEPPRQCSYLADRTASLEYRLIERLTAAEYARLLAQGYRRFGSQFFRPACPHCTECRSVRLLIPAFQPSASQRRILRRNEDLRIELHPLFVTPEILDLYNRYHHFMHHHRDWPSEGLMTARPYHQSFLGGPAHLGRQWLYYLEDRLLGVALMDEVPGAISLVYAFYDPEHRDRSLGTFSILNHMRYGRQQNYQHAYLGYWVEDCPSLSYKGRYQPREILREYPIGPAAPVWE